mmetsp:Transcript_13329/g.38025  ORF Transcript_13329/g.38025 Transcript_13329/m.38025 type:complete len:227 (+) Transcript_13329:88-768(+)
MVRGRISGRLGDRIRRRRRLRPPGTGPVVGRHPVGRGVSGRFHHRAAHRQVLRQGHGEVQEQRQGVPKELQPGSRGQVRRVGPGHCRRHGPQPPLAHHARGDARRPQPAHLVDHHRDQRPGRHPVLRGGDAAGHPPRRGGDPQPQARRADRHQFRPPHVAGEERHTGNYRTEGPRPEEEGFRHHRLLAQRQGREQAAAKVCRQAQERQVLRCHRHLHGAGGQPVGH